MLTLFLFWSLPLVESFSSAPWQRQDLWRNKYTHRTSDGFRSLLKAGPSDEDLAEQEEKFKIVTCMSTACSRKRAALGLDNLSTFGAMYSRASDSRVEVEEGPCIGSCKEAPCVTIQHEDFFGSVALEGMNANEFDKDAFLNIVTEEDADRVWSCVANAVQVMAEAEEEED